MPRNFNWNVWPPNNAAALMRLGLGLLLAANLVAGYFVLRPVGGSPEELRQQATEMRAQIRQQQAALDQMRALAGKIEIGRREGDSFMSKYFLPRRTAYSIILAALNQVASKSKAIPKARSYGLQRVDGSA